VVRLRVRIRFSKQGDLRLIGHRDLMRCFERLFRRAGLNLSFSEGFHPKPRMTFPSALAVGIEGLDEVMEVELAENYDAADLWRLLPPQAPPGLGFHAIEILPEGSRKAQVQSASYEVSIPAARQSALAASIAEVLAAATWPIQRGPDRGPLDLRPLLAELTLAEHVLRMRLRVPAGRSAGPRDVLAALGSADLERHGARLRRTAVEVAA
jgi:radical SAM-linked protein